MAFDTVRVRKVSKDEDETFYDRDGKATLFDEEEEPEDGPEGDAEVDPDEEEVEEVAEEESL